MFYKPVEVGGVSAKHLQSVYITLPSFHFSSSQFWASSFVMPIWDEGVDVVQTDTAVK